MRLYKKTIASLAALACWTPVWAAGQAGDSIVDEHGNPLPEVNVKGKRPDKGHTITSDLRAGFDRPTSHPHDPSKEGNADIEQDCFGSNPHTGMPVVIATGEKYKIETDFTAVNPYSLSLERTYRSKRASGTLFGPNWASSLDIPSLVLNKSQCETFPNGDCVPLAITFTDVTGASTTFTLGPYEGGHEFVYLAKDGSVIYHDYGSVWRLQNEKQVYIYSNSGLIKSLSDPVLGNTLTFEHGEGNRLKTITSKSGHKVQFVWDGDRVSQVVDPNGGTWTYSYNSNRMLTKVMSPDGTEWREYHYEDPNPRFLTGISFNGIRYSTYKYDVNGRVSESGLTGGEDVDKFVYSGNTTWVTDARGQVSTYKFTDLAGSKRVVEILRSGTTTCATAAAKTTYDTNGFKDYSFDWNGNKTDYQFDSRGKLLSVVSAIGTA